MNIAALVANGITLAARLDVAGPVTITRVIPGTNYVPGTDERIGDTPQSFTVVAPEEATSGDKGLEDPHRNRTYAAPAALCAFEPSTGHTLKSAEGVTYRVIDVTPIRPDGVTPVLYLIEVSL